MPDRRDDRPRDHPPDRPLRYRSQMRIRDRGTRLGENAFEKLEETRQEGDAFVDSFSLEIPSCASCLAAMHDPKAVGGACGVCRELVCTGCAETRCDVDNRILCKEHSTLIWGRIVCSTHSLLEVIFRPRQE